MLEVDGRGERGRGAVRVHSIIRVIRGDYIGAPHGRKQICRVRRLDHASVSLERGLADDMLPLLDACLLATKLGVDLALMRRSLELVEDVSSLPVDGRGTWVHLLRPRPRSLRIAFNFRSVCLFARIHD